MCRAFFLSFAYLSFLCSFIEMMNCFFFYHGRNEKIVCCLLRIIAVFCCSWSLLVGFVLPLVSCYVSSTVFFFLIFGFPTLELRVFREQPLYLHGVVVRSVYTLPSPDLLVGFHCMMLLLIEMTKSHQFYKTRLNG